MASVELENILDQAKALSEQDRARLARELVATLDGPPDSDVATAWAREVERRLADIENGTAKAISREELTQRRQNRAG